MPWVNFHVAWQGKLYEVEACVAHIDARQGEGLGVMYKGYSERVVKLTINGPGPHTPEQPGEHWFFERGWHYPTGLEGIPDALLAKVCAEAEHALDKPLEHDWQRRVRLSRVNFCHGAKDGECSWKYCPQLRDGEPEASSRHCPLDVGCPLCQQPSDECDC